MPEQSQKPESGYEHNPHDATPDPERQSERILVRWHEDMYHLDFVDWIPRIFILFLAGLIAVVIVAVFVGAVLQTARERWNPQYPDVVTGTR